MRSNDLSIRQCLDAMDVCIARFALALDEKEAHEAGVDPASLGISPCMRCGAPALNKIGDLWEETLCRRCAIELEANEHARAPRMPRCIPTTDRSKLVERRSAYERWRHSPGQ